MKLIAVGEEAHKKIKALANSEGRTIKGMINQLIKNYEEGKQNG